MDFLNGVKLNRKICLVRNRLRFQGYPNAAWVEEPSNEIRIDELFNLREVGETSNSKSPMGEVEAKFQGDERKHIMTDGIGFVTFDIDCHF
ncbi:hypothetical protein TNCV_2118891 [Trichonephila clavipes]|nr:hypothetical protein TNCV_2118891 [Trichonephila clavipes]